MRIQVSSIIPKGEMFFVVDMEHPELHFFSDDVDEADGTVIHCHPDDEQTVRDVVALVGETEDVDAWAREVRRRTRLLRS